MSKAGFIAIVGRPNAGKSTLLNSILGAQVSIVTPKAQTTRDRVLGILTEGDTQVIFIDTPGIHRARAGGINEYMVREAKEALEAPHAVWYLVDPNSSIEHEIPVLELIEKSGAPVVILMNKVDTLREKVQQVRAESLGKALIEAFTERKIELIGLRKVSGQKQLGIREVLNECLKRIPESPFYYPDPDQLSDRPTRFFVAEKIREQLYHLLGDELPYSCAVEIEKFDEKARPPRIEAVIHVERDSQKGMVIGQGGKKIKEIGMAARIDIEEFLGEKIFLGLRVKVSPDWSENSEELRRMGYNLPSKKGAK